MALIGIIGEAGHGKTELAKILIAKNYQEYAFADPLKQIVSIAFGLSREQLYDPILKETIVPEYGVSPGQLLIFVGTRMFREVICELLPGFSTWVNVFKRKNFNHNKVVVSDVRFIDEAAAIRERNGILIRIVRPGVQSATRSGHISETEQHSIVADATIINDSALNKLRCKLFATIAGIQKQRRYTEYLRNERFRKRYLIARRILERDYKTKMKCNKGNNKNKTS